MHVTTQTRVSGVSEYLRGSPGVLNDIVTQNAKYTFFVCLVQLMSDHWGEPHINMLNASGVCMHVCMYVCMYV